MIDELVPNWPAVVALKPFCSLVRSRSVIICKASKFENFHGINDTQAARAEERHNQIDKPPPVIFCCCLTVDGVVAGNKVLEASKVSSCEQVHVILDVTDPPAKPFMWHHLWNIPFSIQGR